MVQPARSVGGLRGNGEGERGRDHEQGRHDRCEQGHRCSSFVGNVVSPLTQCALGEIRPLLGVDLGHDDPLLHRPVALARVEQVRASTGSGSVASVVEVAPWSRIPEARALFVPRDD